MQRIFAALAWAILAGAACGDEPDPPPRLSAQQQRQLNALRNRYLRAKDDKQRERIAGEAISAGKPFARAIQGLVNRDGRKALEIYGNEFFEQIGKADRIETSRVIAGKAKLQTRRASLVRQSRIAERLREFLEPQPTAPATGDSAAATPAFDKVLRELEDRAVDRWLRERGYGRLQDHEASVAGAINQLRRSAGLNELSVNYKLCLAAREHSQDMVKRGFFSHNSPIRGRRTYNDRARRYGATAIAENIAKAADPGLAVTMWMKSGPHRRNILDPRARSLGIGFAGNKFTLMLGRGEPPREKSGRQNVEQGTENDEGSAK